MKLTPALLLPALCCATSAALDPAHVYIRESQTHRREISDDRRTLSPAAARMVLAQRAGVEEYHAADMTDAQSLQAINDFGSTSNLFTSDNDARRQAIVLFHTDDDVSSILPSEQLSHFHISPLPSIDSTRALLSDLAVQAGITTDDSTVDILPKKLIIDTTIPLNNFRPAGLDDYDIILIRIPTKNTADPASTSPWGPYSMPHTSLKRSKRDQTEQPLDSTPTTTRLSPLASTAKPLKGIFPTCFPSLKTCQNLSQNCTGHGSCSLKYTDPALSKEAPLKYCYACECKPQKKTDGEGRESTTYWGGPACQKKDVSVEFWMIALFSVAMVGLVSFAVGSVWSMGDEELPSVIGAGVSGPVARR